VDLDAARVRWRAESDKIGWEHETPLSAEAVEALEGARRERPCVGDTWLFPAPDDPSQPCSRHLFRDWWQRAEALAGVLHGAGLGWHSLRRKFATDLMGSPLKVLCAIGGWKDAQTVLTCYQRADEASMREALATRQRPLAGRGERPFRHRNLTPQIRFQRMRSPA
jgi:integrase